MSVDAPIRRQALAPDSSFIVQAPAGSGKTSLLVQRYLRLLAIVDAPEEILAITFTRKAAGEMKGRILDSLTQAKQDPEPEQDYLRESWMLARKALARDAALGWNIGENPTRLRIMTVDAFNSLLAAQMPIMSRAGAQVPVVDDAEFLYREAARKLPQSLGGDDAAATHLEVLLSHLDNNVTRLEELVITMLACRDHWLDLVMEHRNHDLSRPLLEAGFTRLIGDQLAALQELVPPDLLNDLQRVAEFSCTRLGEPFHRIVSGKVAQEQLDIELSSWRRLAALFLTQRGTPRKTFTQAQGFVTGNSTEKKLAKDVAETLLGHPTFCKRLLAASLLPNPRYDDEQWKVLLALLETLPVAAAQLELVFREHRQMDFIGVSDAAIYALGNDENPTDLALALDYRIQHVLVDEFQDTSFTQYRLLLLLTAGWQPGDGRTFFCVGDPMQSIYRFRQAEVGLFVRATQEGFPHLPLAVLRLTSNFRSDAGIVAWVNHTFAKICPAIDDLDSGAVGYANSVPELPALETDAVTVHPFFGKDKADEAVRVHELIRTLTHLHPDDNVAVLVSSRLHLTRIIPLLKQSGTRFQAVEIDALPSRPGVQDLLSLTYALLSHSNRTAWLAILRAPWCGLTLDDLHTLVVDRPKTMPVWDLLLDAKGLSGDGQQRMARFVGVMKFALKQRGRLELHTLVEQTWIGLGGPACLQTSDDLIDVRVYLELLRSREIAGDLVDADELQRYLERLFAASDPQANEQVQVMTIHRAKGLQFDSVILPGLGRATSADDAKLLRWLEVYGSHNRRDLLLAPVGASGAKRDPMHEYLRQIERERDRNEQGRLLYVATTRAKKRLHLLGNTNVDEKHETLRAPVRSSLLFHLWPVVQARFERCIGRTTGQLQQQTSFALSGVRLRRLTSDWEMPEPADPPSTSDAHAEPALPQDISFHWVGNTARHVGTVVHLLLQRIANDGVEGWSLERIKSTRWAIESWLQGLGLANQQIQPAADQVFVALEKTLEDDRGRWVLSNRHVNAKSEYPLTGLVDGKYRSVVLDRTFVDENDIRWVIDYKTSRHEGSDLDEFLDNEQLRYTQQMALYGEMMSRMDKRQIRLALYFPLLSGWREWGS